MRTICIALALVALASLPVDARGTARTAYFFPAQVRSTSRTWFAPTPRVQAYVVKYYTVWRGGYKMRYPYMAPKLHCYTAALCVPVLEKAPKA